MPIVGKNIIPIVMLLASVWAVFGFLRPQYGAIQILRAEKARYEKAIDNANEVRILRERLLAEYDSFSEEDWERLHKLLPDRPDGVRLMLELDRLASGFGVFITGFSIDELTSAPQTPVFVPEAVDVSSADTLGTENAPPVPPAHIQTLAITLTVSADYKNFTSFLRELEKHIRMVDVSDLSVTAAQSKDEQEEVYEYSLTLHTYYLK